MYNADPPARAELPSAAALARSTVIAMFAAAAILVFVVLPSEYAIDPTGFGRTLGLTQMGEIKMQLAAEATAEADLATQAAPIAAPSTGNAAPAAAAAGVTSEPGRTDDVSFVLTPGQGAEYKLVMRRGARARYSWSTAGGAVNFDLHGSGSGQRVRYEVGRSVPGGAGELEAAFDGDHGWFFRNRTEGDVTVTLRTEGDYAELKRVL